MGKINTNTLLLIGAGLAAVYIFTRPKTTPPVYPPYPGYPGALPASGNPTATIANDATSVLNNLLNLF